MLPSVIAVAIAVVLGGLCLMVVLRLLRAYLQQMRYAKALPYVPVEDPLPAAPVAMGPSVLLAGGLVLAWSLLHLAVAAMWLATGAVVPREFLWAFGATYACVCAIISGLGAVLLMNGRPFGRKMIAWGELLLGAVAFLLMVGSISAPSDPHSPEEIRRVGYLLGSIFAAHIAVDILLGRAAQRVGLPEGWKSGWPPRMLEVPPTPAALPGEEPLDS